MGNHHLLSGNHLLKQNWHEDSIKTWDKYNKIENVFFHIADNTVSRLSIYSSHCHGIFNLLFPHLFPLGLGEGVVNKRQRIHLLRHKVLAQVFFLNITCIEVCFFNIICLSRISSSRSCSQRGKKKKKKITHKPRYFHEAAD